MHYLIDLDNTLLDTFYFEDNELHFYWTKDFKKDFGVSPVILKDLFSAEFLKQISTGQDTSFFIDAFIKKHSFNLSAADFIDYWLSRDANLKYDVWNWIQGLKSQGHSLHIASNQPEIRMQYLWNHFADWKDVFDKVFTSPRLGVAKPHEDFFRLIQKDLNVPFSQMCLVDDDKANIDSAQKLGVRTILFTDINCLK